MPTNMLLMGAAFQHGVLPVSLTAVEEAIALNGAAVDATLTAFRWGRAAAIDHDAVVEALAAPRQAVVTVDAQSAAEAGRCADGHAELEHVLAVRITDLADYQDRAYGNRYADEVRRLTALATERVGPADGARLGIAYARGLHKLMAYKDEYEVARLHLDPAEIARREAEYGLDARVSVLLHPPLLRAMGMHRKLKIGGWAARPTFAALRAARWVRGTRLDVFGYAAVRALERELIAEYRAAVRTACERLNPATVEGVVAVADTPDLVRGYEDVKLAAVERFRVRVEELLTGLDEVAPVSCAGGTSGS